MGISVQSSGIAVEKSKFYLVNLNADPSMNELLVYYLQVTLQSLLAGITLFCMTTNVLGHLCIIFLCIKKVVIFPFSSHGEWSHQSFSSKELSL